MIESSNGEKLFGGTVTFVGSVPYSYGQLQLVNQAASRDSFFPSLRVQTHGIFSFKLSNHFAVTSFLNTSFILNANELVFTS